MTATHAVQWQRASSPSEDGRCRRPQPEAPRSVMNGQPVLRHRRVLLEGRRYVPDRELRTVLQVVIYRQKSHILMSDCYCSELQ